MGDAVCTQYDEEKKSRDEQDENDKKDQMRMDELEKEKKSSDERMECDAFDKENKDQEDLKHMLVEKLSDDCSKVHKDGHHSDKKFQALCKSDSHAKPYGRFEHVG